MKNHAPALAVLAAASLWGFISIFIRGLTALGWASTQIVAARCLLSALLSLAFLAVKDRQLLRVKPKDLWVFGGTGLVSMVFFNWCYFTSITRCGAGLAVVLLYTSPIWVMLFSALFFKEKITPQKLAALVITVAGCVLVAGGGGLALPAPSALVVGVLAGVGYALYSIFGQVALGKGYHTLTVTTYTFVFAAIGCLFLVPLPGLAALCTTPAAWVHILGNTVLCSLAPYLLYTWGLGRMEAGKAAILATSEPLVATLVGIFLWKEPFTPAKALGVAMIFAAVALLNRREKRVG